MSLLRDGVLPCFLPSCGYAQGIQYHVMKSLLANRLFISQHQLPGGRVNHIVRGIPSLKIVHIISQKILLVPFEELRGQVLQVRSSRKLQLQHEVDVAHDVQPAPKLLWTSRQWNPRGSALHCHLTLRVPYRYQSVRVQLVPSGNLLKRFRLKLSMFHFQ